MSDDKNIDWDGIAASDGESNGNGVLAVATPQPMAAPLPDLPLVIGRLPIKCGAKKAVIQLPEATSGVKCAFTVANTSVLSDCNNEADDVCLPSVLYSRPLNDREIEVVFAGKGEGTVKGLGWTADPYGGQLKTRSIEFGQPFVEVLVVASRNIGCGCDSENWASEDYQQ
ncbi:MAG TPA: hypothetical protein VK028_05800 [Micromonosporaceae bacterium]|nr:hypothetical protein [Micromonosporaceae bacterium]